MKAFALFGFCTVLALAGLSLNPSNAYAQRGGESRGSSPSRSDDGPSRGSSSDTRGSSSSSSSGSSSSDWGSSGSSFGSSDGGCYDCGGGYYYGGGGSYSPRERKTKFRDLDVGDRVKVVASGLTGTVSELYKRLFNASVCIEVDLPANAPKNSSKEERCGFRPKDLKKI